MKLTQPILSISPEYLESILRLNVSNFSFVVGYDVINVLTNSIISRMIIWQFVY